MDFVTFEIAKKLKEKGYPQNFSRRKSIKAASYHYYNFKGEIDGSVDDNHWYVSCPFIAQVLKWLREEKGLHIEPHKVNGVWDSCVVDLNEVDEDCDMFCRTIKNTNCIGDSYEEAALAGVEYILDNLI